MEAYANVLLIAIPFFFVLIAIEAFYGWWKGELTFRSLDTISSLRDRRASCRERV